MENKSTEVVEDQFSKVNEGLGGVKGDRERYLSKEERDASDKRCKEAALAKRAKRAARGW